MKVTVYLHPERSWKHVSGVGKHINNMALGLAARAGYDVQLLAVREQLEADGRMNPASPLRDLPLTAIPWRRWWLERMWEGLNQPKPEWWSGKSDWIFCPAETPIAKGHTPLVVTLHDANAFEPMFVSHPDKRLYARRFQALLWRIVKRADLLLTVSEFSKSRFIHFMGIKPEKIAVVYNGVEDMYYRPGSTPGGGKPYVMVVGGLTLRKNPRFTIAVAKALAEIAPDVTIRVAGLNHEPYATEAKAAANLELLGYVDDARLVELLAGSTAMLFPTIYEGFGIPALEAMAAGTPVLYNPIPALLETVGPAGVAIDPEDAAGAAREIARLAGDAAARAALVAAGRARAEQFRWARCAGLLAKALESGHG